MNNDSIFPSNPEASRDSDKILFIAVLPVPRRTPECFLPYTLYLPLCCSKVHMTFFKIMSLTHSMAQNLNSSDYIVLTCVSPKPSRVPHTQVLSKI